MVSFSEIKGYTYVLFLRVHITSGSPLQNERNLAELSPKQLQNKNACYYILIIFSPQIQNHRTADR